MFKKAKSAAAPARPPVAPDPLQFEARALELEQRRRETLAEIIAAEKAGAIATPAAQVSDAERRAMVLLAGDDGEHVVEFHPNVGLFEMRQELAAIDRAIQLARDAAFLGYVERLRAERSRRMDEWREAVHETAMLIARLQRANRVRERIAREIAGKIGVPVDLPSRVPPRALLGCGLSNDGEAYEFHQRAIRDGIITPGEVARERGDDDAA